MHVVEVRAERADAVVLEKEEEAMPFFKLLRSHLL